MKMTNYYMYYLQSYGDIKMTNHYYLQSFGDIMYSIYFIWVQPICPSFIQMTIESCTYSFIKPILKNFNNVDFINKDNIKLIHIPVHSFLKIKFAGLSGYKLQINIWIMLIGLDKNLVYRLMKFFGLTISCIRQRRIVG